MPKSLIDFTISANSTSFTIHFTIVDIYKSFHLWAYKNESKLLTLFHLIFLACRSQDFIQKPSTSLNSEKIAINSPGPPNTISYYFKVPQCKGASVYLRPPGCHLVVPDVTWKKHQLLALLFFLRDYHFAKLKTLQANRRKVVIM